MYLTLFVLASSASFVSGQDLGTILNDNPDTAPFSGILAGYPDVLNELQSTRDITLLVPSESALSELDREDSDATEVERLLRYHVIQGSYSAMELLEQTSPFMPTLMKDAGVSGGQRVQVAGDVETVNIFSGLNNNATIDQGNRDLEFDGGYAHIIDSVLTLPRSIQDTSIAAGLTSFASAINSSSISVEAEDDCTFFVPTNEAFMTVGSAFQNVTPEDIDRLVLYHFINDTTPIYTPRIDHEQWIPALRVNVAMSYQNGDELFINSARVTQANILVENGVVHVIDHVLNPEDTGGQPPDSAESSSAYPDVEVVEAPPFTDQLTALDVDETVSRGPQSTPLGTLSESSEQDVQTEGGDQAESQEEEAENSAQRLQVALLLVALLVASVMASM